MAFAFWKVRKVQPNCTLRSAFAVEGKVFGAVLVSNVNFAQFHCITLL